jgi:hypothetical protein
MNDTRSTIDLSRIRRLRGVTQLRAISAALAESTGEDVELLGLLLVPLATPPAPIPGPGVLSLFQRGVQRVRVGGDPSALADAALFQLARAWSRWTARVRSASLPIGRGRWSKFAEVLAREPIASMRAGLPLLAVDSMDSGLAPALNLLLGDQDRGVAQAAEGAWVEIAARLSRLSPARLSGVPRMRDAIVETDAQPNDDRPWRAALAQALRAFPDHRCRGILLATLLLVDSRSLRQASTDACRDPLGAIVLSREEAASGSLRGFVRTSKLPIAAERALEWLTYPPLARAGADRLAAVTTSQELAALARRWSLSRRPAREVMLREVAPAIFVRPNGSSEADSRRPLAEDARRIVPTMLASLRLGTGERSRLMEPLLLDPSPSVRHAFARLGTHRDVVDLAFDADPRVAGSAARRASLIGTGRTNTDPAHELQRRHAWHALARTRDAGVRALAAAELAHVSCWESGLLGARLAVRRALFTDREGTLRGLADRLRAASPADLTSLLGTVRGVGLSGELEETLAELAARCPGATPDQLRALASIVSALGESRSAESLDLLQAFRSHGDARVRANAVQALGRRARVDAWNARRLVASMIELKGDAQHRVRANALRSIMDVGSGGELPNTLATPALARPDDSHAAEALESLISMLTDDRTPHRLAGVWLAGRTLHRPRTPTPEDRSPELSARLTEIARFDSDAAVRHRAVATAERLARQTRLGWMTPKPEAAPAGLRWSAS